MKTDEDEERALQRLRTLRRDGYRCGHRDGRRPCGAFASQVGVREDGLVALCLEHAGRSA